MNPTGYEVLGWNPKTEGLHIERTVDAIIEPVTLEELKLALKIYETGDDTDLAVLLKATRQAAEAYTNRGFIEQTWVQTADNIGPVYKLRRKPILAVDSIQYISDLNSDTWVTVPSTSYVLGGNRVRTRSSWPSHRGFASWKTTFRVGYADLPATPDDAAKTAARAAVPENLKRAICQWVGHFFENREGQGGEAKYEVTAKLSGTMPPNVKMLLDPFVDWSLIG